jgi:hypothetical protein
MIMRHANEFSILLMQCKFKNGKRSKIYENRNIHYHQVPSGKHSYFKCIQSGENFESGKNDTVM